MAEQDKYYRLLHSSSKSFNKNEANSFSETELKQWNSIKEERRIIDIAQLPVRIRKKITMLSEYIFKQQPTAKIKLTGSWYKGSWIDADTPVHVWQLRKKITGKTNESDLDIVIKADRKFTGEELSIATTMQVHVWDIAYRKAKGVEIKNPAFPELANLPRRIIS